jgi:hypothetical protein
MSWPFDDPRNVAVFTSRFVVEEEHPIFYVTHDLEDGAWQFHAHNHMETTDEDIRLVALEEVYQRDETIGDLRDLPCGWHAWRQTPTSPWQRQEMPKGAMFYLAFDGVPMKEHPDFDSFGGSGIYCWIIADSLNAAESQARNHLEESGWFIKEYEEGFEVDETSFEDSEMLQYYQQAEIDGEVFLFHIYPARESEETDKSEHDVDPNT